MSNYSYNLERGTFSRPEGARQDGLAKDAEVEAISPRTLADIELAKYTKADPPECGNRGTNGALANDLVDVRSSDSIGE